MQLSHSQPVHPLWLRCCHWVNAVAIAGMLFSGWRIYNASPLFHFKFPTSLTLGGWLGGALQWHFTLMWVLVINGAVYFCWVSPASAFGANSSRSRGRC